MRNLSTVNLINLLQLLHVAREVLDKCVELFVVVQVPHSKLILSLALQLAHSHRQISGQRILRNIVNNKQRIDTDLNIRVNDNCKIYYKIMCIEK